MKVCTKCNISKELSLFPKREKCKNGFSSWYKSCHKEYTHSKPIVINIIYYSQVRNSICRGHKPHSLDGILLKSYYSLANASSITNIPESSISLCCNGKRKTANRFIWKYA